MAVYVCRRCGYEAASEWEGSCPGCSGFYRAKKMGVDSEEQKQRSTFAAAVHIKRNYVETGVAGFDKVIGGGVVPGSCILIGGFRGAGKSSLLCMVCDAITKTRASALYASSEEGADGVLRIVQRLGIINDSVEVLGNQTIIERVIEHQKKTRPFLSVYDSLQKYRSEFGSGGADAVISAIIRHHRDAKTVGVIVNQMTKGGEMKGDTGASHDVDTVLVLGYPKDDDEECPPNKEGQIRVLCVDGKNRNGAENEKSFWKMHGKDDTHPGLLECVPARSLLVEEESPKRGRYRRREAMS